MTQEVLDRYLNKTHRHREWSDLLNERELEAFSLLTMGLWPHQICEEMAIGSRELKSLKAAIRKKLGLASEIELLKLVASHLNGPGSLYLSRFGSKHSLGAAEDPKRISPLAIAKRSKP